jgi:hypothetical protein
MGNNGVEHLVDAFQNAAVVAVVPGSVGTRGEFAITRCLDE